MRLDADRSTREIVVRRCRTCGHRTAAHLRLRSEDQDYHRQYEQQSYLASLERTRRRQSRRILDLLRPVVPLHAPILDFGSGRGWFLDEARLEGRAPLAGADTSSLAVDLIRERGLVGLVSDPALAGWPRLVGELPFRPRLVTLLDVVEHFPSDELIGTIRRVIAPFDEPPLLVLKVPVSEGLLYRVASAGSRLGLAGPFHQLWQVGTFPPHFHYFSRRSLERLVTALGYEVEGCLDDLDFEPEDFSSRVEALRPLGKAVGRAAGSSVAAFAGMAGLDTRVVLARPRAA